MSKAKLEVCLSPSLLHLYDTQNATVVIIDIFRATTTMVSAIFHGAKSVIPVDSVEKCIELGKSTPDSITAGERDGYVAPGLEYGNSPTLYSSDFVEGKNLILTTTNGTRLLFMVKDAQEILIGAFTNLTVTAKKLKEQNQHTILACASWKDRVNMEDTLFAGALVDRLQDDFEVNCDSAHIAHELYRRADQHILPFLEKSNHFKRLSDRKYEKDLRYSTTIDQNPIVCYYKNDKIIGELN